MATKFALPTDPKQRQQMLILGAIVGIGLIVAVVMFGITPQLKDRQDKLDALKVLEDDIAKATKDTQGLTLSRQANYECLHSIIEDTVSPFFIQPELGNYILVAERILKNVISEAGVPRTNITVQEQGLNDFMITPGVNNDRSAICRTYTARVTMKCGYNKLANVLAHIQESNPYIAINGLTIEEIATDTRKHQVEFQIQWPTWRAVDIQTRLQTDYRAAAASAPTPIVATNTVLVSAATATTNSPAGSNAVPAGVTGIAPSETNNQTAATSVTPSTTPAEAKP